MSFRSGGLRARCWRRQGRSFWKLYRKFCRPGDCWVGAHETEAAHTCFDSTMVLVQDRGGVVECDAEHQLLPLLGGLDALWRELRVRCHEADRRGKDELGNWIEDRARLASQPNFAGPVRGRGERHIDVLEIED